MPDRTSYPLRSPWRFAAAAAALCGGISHVVEAEDQYHPGLWFGLLFTSVTVAWFVLAVLLARRDTRPVWRSGAVIAACSVLVWYLGRQIGIPEVVDDLGLLSGPAMLVQFLACVLVLLATAMTLTRTGAEVQPSPRQRRWTVLAGAAVLVVG